MAFRASVSVFIHQACGYRKSTDKQIAGWLQRQWRIRQVGETRSYASVNTSKGMDSARPAYNKYAITGEYAPVYIVMGFVSVAIAMALHTIKQQVFHCPNVNISKKRRESIAELEIPRVASSNGEKYINKSFLRKVAHIRKDPSTRSHEAGTLKDGGFNPKGH